MIHNNRKCILINLYTIIQRIIPRFYIAEYSKNFFPEHIKITVKQDYIFMSIHTRVMECIAQIKYYLICVQTVKAMMTVKLSHILTHQQYILI